MLPVASTRDGGQVSGLTDLRAVADALPQLLWVVGVDGLLTFVNAAWREYVGLDVGSSSEDRLDFVHPDDRAGLDEALLQRVPEREFRIRRASDGTYRWHLLRWHHVRPPTERRSIASELQSTCTNATPPPRNRRSLPTSRARSTIRWTRDLPPRRGRPLLTRFVLEGMTEAVVSDPAVLHLYRGAACWAR